MIEEENQLIRVNVRVSSVITEVTDIQNKTLIQNQFELSQKRISTK